MDKKWMQEALKEAEKAKDKGEVPVGAVVVWGDQIVGRGFNQMETLQDATAHGEIIAITAASQALHSWRLEETTLYVTLEPCAMCAGAIIQSRISRVVFGPMDPKAGACGSLYNLLQDSRLNHQVDITTGAMEEECSEILKEFFKKLREKKPD
jgi:tRNA(adenine34) deaminase